MNSTTSNDDQSDETIPSGSGEVSKECDVEILTNWNEILIQWKKNYLERPKGLQILVRKGSLFNNNSIVIKKFFF